MDLDPQGTSRGGGMMPGPQGTTFPAAPSTTAFMPPQYLPFASPANQATAYNTGPFSLFAFAGHTPMIVVPAMPPPMQAETWQAAYTTTLSMQQQLHERVAELTHRNSAVQAEVDRLRQEKTELQRRIQEMEQKFVQRDLELTRHEVTLLHRQTEMDGMRRGTFHPYHDTRSPSASSSSSGNDYHRNRDLATRMSSPPSTSSRSESVAARSAETDRVRRGNGSDDTSESDIVITGDSLSTHDAMLQSSERARVGLPDPSVETHPQSDWYLWYRTPGASIETAPEFSDSPTTKPGTSLPLWAAKYIGAKAEAMEKKHIGKAEQATDKGEGLQTPQHDRTPPNLGPWMDVVIATANQAHNLRHLAVNKQDKFAARAYREYN
ncbi:hypothetical protein LXA43DRAFT_1104161 [Ganoderma leucocontextum]|nr:hypothetical protein LXA43DRAFT_1104161 [Ganoderma leucocontextum]